MIANGNVMTLGIMLRDTATANGDYIYLQLTYNVANVETDWSVIAEPENW